jgi:hypothetical protein
MQQEFDKAMKHRVSRVVNEQHPGSHTYIKEIEKWGDYGKDLEDEMIHSTFNKTEGRLSMGGNAPISNCFFHE